MPADTRDWHREPQYPDRHAVKEDGPRRLSAVRVVLFLLCLLLAWVAPVVLAWAVALALFFVVAVAVAAALRAFFAPRQ